MSALDMVLALAAYLLSGVLVTLCCVRVCPGDADYWGWGVFLWPLVLIGAGVEWLRNDGIPNLLRRYAKRYAERERPS